MDEIVSQRVEFFVRLLCLCKSVLSFFEFNFGDDFVQQVIGVASRCQVCSKVFNVLLKHNFRRVCPQEPERFSFNESFFIACWVVAVVVCVLNVLAVRHLYFSRVLAARKKNLSNARARKNKHTARMLADARKDHSIPLFVYLFCCTCFNEEKVRHTKLYHRKTILS